MAGKFRWGFKAESERRAVEWRERLRLARHAPLDPRRIAEHLGIAVVTIAEVVAVAGLARRTSEYLLSEGREDFSAVTLVENGRARLIVENEAHAHGRRSNSIAHEVSHVLLKHEPHPPFATGGTRQWFTAMEREADWLAGALLVPRDAALAIVKANVDLARAAETYQVSSDLMRQRLNVTGAYLQARRSVRRESPRR